MTFDDLKVIVLGSVALLAIFLAARAVFVSRTVDPWAVVRRYLVVRVVDVVVPDPFGTASAPASGASDDALPQPWHQTNSEIDADREPTQESSLRQLSRTNLIVLLAIQRKDDGEYLFSSNEIKRFVGGRAEVVGDTIAAVRGTPKPAPNAPLKRPANGW